MKVKWLECYQYLRAFEETSSFSTRSVSYTCLPSTGEFVQGNTSEVMEAVISVPTLPNLHFPGLETNSSQLFGVRVSRWRSVVDGERVESRKSWNVVTRGVSRKKQLRSLCSLPSSSQSSSQEGDAENLPIFEKFCDVSSNLHILGCAWSSVCLRTEHFCVISL